MTEQERMAAIRLRLTDRDYRDRLQLAADAWNNTRWLVDRVDDLTAALARSEARVAELEAAESELARLRETADRMARGH